MKTSDQLAWERRNGPKAAAAAFAAGLFSLASLAIQLIFVGTGGGNEREGLLRIHDHQSELLLSVIAQALAVVVLAGALYYLLRAIIARRPEQLKFLWPLIALAPVLLVVGAVLTQLNLADLADKFVSEGVQTNTRAKNLIDDRDVASGIIASAGTLFLALSIVMVSVNAMRAGLLSRFMGVLGIVAGALLVLPLLPSPINFVQLFWTVALGVLFLDRWPNGRGPAWSVVEAIPWPTAAQIRGVAAGGEPETDPPGAPAQAQPGAKQPVKRRSSRKKKRKR